LFFKGSKLTEIFIFLRFEGVVSKKESDVKQHTAIELLMLFMRIKRHPGFGPFEFDVGFGAALQLQQSGKHKGNSVIGFGATEKTNHEIIS
jgi:hypothetical protein